MEELENQKPLGVDTFEQGDLSGKLCSYEVSSPDKYGCGDMMKQGRSKYQLASLKTMLKEYNKDGDLIRVKIKEQIFKLEPSRREMKYRVDSALYDEMKQGCHIENGKRENFVLVEPSQEVSHVENYKNGQLVSVEPARAHCHMSGKLDHAMLLPGDIFAVRMSGKSDHDSGEISMFTIYLKNKLSQLEEPIDMSPDQWISDEIQVCVFIFVSLLVVGALACGFMTFIKQSWGYIRVREPEKGLHV
ncbi:hypothetical protein FOA43_001998 [Brettanomyces nanus]|uniref:Uncharacterized protein n=1 Tax=Eeniella nana TaxID=13502 RepID=A0A875RZS2_EENNA|nr:uncharacterized protein FOA43_001998 [Brettanomyces nanus]QPG74666.1 hypothetical protein FOA43_001998 [Brettanomyces nanus]